MSYINDNLGDLDNKISEICLKTGRNANDITLVAVSKTFPEKDIRCAIECGQLDFGENKLQEAEPKILTLPSDLIWHYVGKIQTNKVNKIIKAFAVIHSLDSIIHADSINQVAGKLDLKPKLFLQINLAGEVSKPGFTHESVISSIHTLMGMKNLTIIGLMCIPPVDAISENSRKWFIKLRELKNQLDSEHNCKLPYLSMGMSNDYEIAIEEGSTHIRVGSSIFGNRSYTSDKNRITMD